MKIGVLTRWQWIDQPQSIALIPLDFGRRWLAEDADLSLTYLMPHGSKQEDVDRWYRPVVGRRRVEFREAFPRVTSRLAGAVAGDALAEALDDVDVVLSNQPAGTMMLRRFVDKPWVQWQMWSAVAATTKGATGLASMTDVHAEIMSSWYADLNCWESEFMLEAFRRTVHDWFRPEVVRQVMEKSRVTVNGVGRPLPRKPLRTKCRVLWGANHKIASKRLDESLKVMDMMRRHVDAEWQVASPMEFDNPSFASNVSRDDFARMISRSDVFVCNSEIETYGVGWLEMLGGGMLGVFRRAWWNEALLPDWYPFLADSFQEQVEMSVVLVRQWPDGPLWEYQHRIMEWVHEKHGIDGAAHRLLDEIKGVAG